MRLRLLPACEEKIGKSLLRSRPKTTSTFGAQICGWIWFVRLSKAAGITGYFVVDSTLREDFVIEEQPKTTRR